MEPKIGNNDSMYFTTRGNVLRKLAGVSGKKKFNVVRLKIHF